MRKFMDGDAVLFGFEKMRASFWFLVGAMLIALLVSLISSAVNSFVPQENTSVALIILTFVVSLIIWVLGIIIHMGMINISLKLSNNEKCKYADLFNSYTLFFKYLFGGILYALIVLIGLVLLIFPGIIWAVKLQFWPYLVVDKKMGPIQALVKSSAMTTDAEWSLLLFVLLLGAVNVIGALCLLVGLFATVPATMIAYAYVYKKLAGSAKTA